jgi:hypothetical protein
MRRLCCLVRDRRFSAAALACAVSVFGCGHDAGVGKACRVSGRITVGERPVTAMSTVVIFKPDAGRGNKSPFEPTGTVDRHGNYALSTKRQEGAPPGWYRVIVTATELREDISTGQRRRRPVPRSLLPARYGRAETTDLLVEVAENRPPGDYDLKLTP